MSRDNYCPAIAESISWPGPCIDSENNSENYPETHKDEICDNDLHVKISGHLRKIWSPISSSCRKNAMNFYDSLQLLRASSLAKEIFMASPVVYLLGVFENVVITQKKQETIMKNK